MKALEINNLTYAYNDLNVLEDINLSIEEKEFLGIIGPNGGGKSTLIKLITGLLEPKSGSIKVFGKAPANAGDEIGYVPQFFNFDVNYPISVFDVVMMGRLKSSNKKEDKLIVKECLAKVSMLEHSGKLIGELSGGQKQRVLIARALAVKPRILLLDEPTASIDSKFGKTFYELLTELNKNLTIILVSHDIGVVSRYVKKIGCLNKNLVFHNSKEISKEMLEATYQCPVDLIAHGVPHRVLDEHN